MSTNILPLGKITVTYPTCDKDKKICEEISYNSKYRSENT